jgi:hypothetical protein
MDAASRQTLTGYLLLCTNSLHTPTDFGMDNRNTTFTAGGMLVWVSILVTSISLLSTINSRPLLGLLGFTLLAAQVLGTIYIFRGWSKSLSAEIDGLYILYLFALCGFLCWLLLPTIH